MFVVATLSVVGICLTERDLSGLWTARVSLDGRPVDEDYFEFLPR